MSKLFTERIPYKPFEYPQAFDYWMKQQQAHWLHTEVPMHRMLPTGHPTLNPMKRILLEES